MHHTGSLRRGFLACIALAFGIARADTLDHWTSGTFPAPGDPFSSGSPPFQSHIQRIAFGNGKFVAIGIYQCAVGCNGDVRNVTFTSSDALNWQWHSNDVWNGVSSILYAGGKFVAANANGIASRIIISGDGASWSPAAVPSAPSPHGFFYRDIAYGSSRYVAVGPNWADTTSARRTNVLFSLDGLTWEHALWSQGSPTVPKPDSISVAFGNGYFLGLALTNAAESSEIRVSTMTQTTPLMFPWTALTYRPNGVDAEPFPVFNDVAFGNGVFVLAGANVLVVTNGTFAGNTSVGGALITPPTSNPIQKVIFDNGRFIAAAGGDILSSVDGAGWTKHTTLSVNGEPPFITDLAFGDGRYLAVAGTNYFVTVFTGVEAIPGTGRLRISGTTGLAHEILASTSLTSNSWQVITNLTLTTSPQEWIDPQGSILPRRFYRTRLLP